MDSLAVSYASELARRGIETSIIVPGAFTKGTNHFAHSGSPADVARASEYDQGPYAGLPDMALKGLASLEPADADAGEVAKPIVNVVGTPFGKRPFRTHIDRRRMALRSSTVWPIGFARKCSGASALRICCHLVSLANDRKRSSRRHLAVRSS